MQRLHVFNVLNSSTVTTMTEPLQKGFPEVRPWLETAGSPSTGPVLVHDHAVVAVGQGQKPRLAALAIAEYSELPSPPLFLAIDAPGLLKCPLCLVCWVVCPAGKF